MRNLADHRLARIDLRALSPTPDGLLKILDALASLGYDGFVLLYEDTFPWQIDERFHDGYDEQVVAGVADWCRRRKLVHVVELTAYGLLDCLVDLPSFAYCRDLLSSGVPGSRYEASAKGVIEQVLTDLHSVLPYTNVLFSPSSLYGDGQLSPGLSDCLEALCLEREESEGRWFVASGVESGNSRARPICPTRVAPASSGFEYLSIPTAAGYGGPAMVPLPAAISHYAAAIGAAAPTLSRELQEAARALAELTEAEVRARTALDSAEQIIAATVLLPDRQYAAASVHIRRALSRWHAGSQELQEKAAAVEAAVKHLLATRGVARYISQLLAPLLERGAGATARGEELIERFSFVGGTPE